MAVKKLTARQIGNAMLQLKIDEAKPFGVCEETGTLYVNAWSKLAVICALTRTYTALKNAYSDHGDTVEWDMNTVSIKIVDSGFEPSRVRNGNPLPPPIGTIIEIDVRNFR